MWYVQQRKEIQCIKAYWLVSKYKNLIACDEIKDSNEEFDLKYQLRLYLDKARPKRQVTIAGFVYFINKWIRHMK